MPVDMPVGHCPVTVGDTDTEPRVRGDLVTYPAAVTPGKVDAVGGIDDTQVRADGEFTDHGGAG